MVGNQFKGEVQIPASDDIRLAGNLTVPADAKGIVVFAHGSGSSRLSSRNRQVAEALSQSGFATLLFDLLTVSEDQNYQNRFNIDLLTERLLKAIEWTLADDRTKGLPTGLFGASTGAAATLKAAAQLGNSVKAIVSRGGRPDLAIPVLPNVTAPTLLIVGGFDQQVIGLNQEAYRQLRAEKEIKIVEGASHLFEEPGKLEIVARMAAQWFDRYLMA